MGGVGLTLGIGSNCCYLAIKAAGLTIHSSRRRFAARLNSGVGPHMKPTAAVVFGLLACGAANAGCDEELFGKRRGIEYYIGDEACGLPETRLIISKPGRRYYEVGQSFSFLGQCSWTASGFACRTSGATALAGTTYKRVRIPGRQDACGNKLLEQYHCVSGCRHGRAPKVFSISPYEC